MPSAPLHNKKFRATLRMLQRMRLNRYCLPTALLRGLFLRASTGFQHSLDRAFSGIWNWNNPGWLCIKFYEEHTLGLLIKSKIHSQAHGRRAKSCYNRFYRSTSETTSVINHLLYWMKHLNSVAWLSIKTFLPHQSSLMCGL